MINHATYAASASERWLNCPGSVQLCQRIDYAEPVSKSKYEGRAAHLVLKNYIARAEIPTVSPDGVEITTEMHEHALDFIERVKNKGVPIDPIWSESRVYIDWLLEGQYGIKDYGWYDLNTDIMYVWDYKYGHRAVEAFNNAQLAYYALDGRFRDSVKKVVATIVQPRGYHHEGIERTWVFSRSELNEWAGKFHKAFHDAKRVDAPLNVGKQCGMCPARGMCPALYERVKELATVLDAPVSLTPQEVGERLRMMNELHAHAGEAKSALHTQGVHLAGKGQAIPGFNLTHSPTKRQLTGESTLTAVAPMFGVMPESLYDDKKLKSITVLEKILPKEMIEMCTTKPVGAAILVPDESYKQAEKVFGKFEG